MAAGSLADAVVVITGGAGGLGRALGLDAVRRGAIVIIADTVDAADVVALLRATGGRAESVPTDVADPASWAALVSRVRSSFGGVNVLVNNAMTGGGGGPLTLADPDELRQSFAVNVLGPMYGIRAVHPLLRKAAAGGALAQIINIGSEHSLGVPPHVPAISAYTVAKHALLGVTDTARRDLAADGIGVMLAAPGWILTDAVRALVRDDVDPADIWRQSVIAGRAQEPADVARIIFDAMLEGRELVVTNPASKGFALERARKMISEIESSPGG